MTSFACPVGPKSDLNELEYVCALHQTFLRRLRTNAKVSVRDIEFYPRSRYGLDVERDRIHKVIHKLFLFFFSTFLHFLAPLSPTFTCVDTRIGIIFSVPSLARCAI